VRAPLVVAVVGATATGKTALSEALAIALDGEVVCADSRQVFRELHVGTGKPSHEELTALPHHLFDALSVGERASAGWYARAAHVVCADLHARGRVAVLVGGSGLYLGAARRGLAQEPPPDPARREALRAEAVALGAPALHARLAALDPDSAARLAPNDTQRVTRALEVVESSGKPLGWWHAQPHGPAVAGEWRVIEVTCDVATLDERIAERTRWMFDHGIVEETAALVAAGRESELRALRAVGYDEALALAAGRLDRAAAETATNLRTRQLAKRQRTWFRHQVEATRVDGRSPLSRQLAEARSALGS
jgi:tRNA dimethylallyltransferase